MCVRRRFRATAVALACCAGMLVSASSAGAVAGDLDPSFGTGGVAHAQPNASFTSGGASELAVQPDGKIVVAGAISDTPGPGPASIAVGRFNADGSPDLTFGGGTGTALFPIAGYLLNTVTGVGVQPSGRIIVGARIYENAAGNRNVHLVLGITPEGALDTDFDAGVNANGVFITTVGAPGPPDPSEAARKLLVQSDGKIVASGSGIYSGGQLYGAIMRLNVDGTPDASFSGDGKYTFDASPGSFDDPRGLARVPGAGYVLVGRAPRPTFPTTETFTIYRVTEAGALDPSFVGGPENVSTVAGTVIMTMGDVATDFSEAYGAAVQTDGKILAGGYSALNGASGFAALARYSSTGALDPSFGNNGRVLTRFGGTTGDFAAINSLEMQPDGKILAAGFVQISSVTYGLLARFATNGGLDLTFGSGGYRLLGNVSNPFQIGGGALQPDGRYVSTAGDGYVGFTIARFLGDPPSSPATPPIPTSKILSPSKKRLRAKSLKAFRGTAGPAGSVAKVEIAVRKIDRSLLKKKHSCLWLNDAKSRLKKVKAKRGKCSAQRWLKASGMSAWSFKLKKPLIPGSYQLFVRVTLTGGQTQTKFTAGNGNFFAFSLR